MTIPTTSIRQTYFQEVIDISNNAIFLCDLNGNIKEANAVTAQFFGYPNRAPALLGLLKKHCSKF